MGTSHSFGNSDVATRLVAQDNGGAVVATVPHRDGMKKVVNVSARMLRLISPLVFLHILGIALYLSFIVSLLTLVVIQCLLVLRW